jgi:hypothetical protein
MEPNWKAGICLDPRYLATTNYPDRQQR